LKSPKAHHADIEANKETLRDSRAGVADRDRRFRHGLFFARVSRETAVNALKIDRSFIITMTSNPQSMTIVSTIISSPIHWV